MSDYDDYKREIGSFFDLSLLIQKKGILCAKCNKKVERWEVRQSHMTDTLTFKVFCHGAMDEVTFTHMQLMEITDFQPGVAFTDQKELEDGRQPRIADDT